MVSLEGSEALAVAQQVTQAEAGLPSLAVHLDSELPAHLYAYPL